MSGLFYCLFSGREVKVQRFILYLILYLNIKVASAIFGNISVESAASFQPVKHHALLGQSFVNISGISVVRCSARCLRHQRCFSFNYDHSSRVCQMNNATREQVSDDSFEGIDGFGYYVMPREVLPAVKTGVIKKCYFLILFLKILFYFLLF